MTTEPTEKHREEARAIIEEFFPPDANPEAQWKTRLIESFSSTLSARDAEKLVACGDGNKVGGCGDQVSIVDGFRCSDCLAWFHRDCINEHFTLDAYVKKLRELREQGVIDDWKKEVATAKATLTARDTEVSKVLEGLRYSEVGWCWCKGPGHHISACLAARELYNRLQPDSTSDT